VGLWDSESRAGLAAWAFLVVMRHTLEQPPQGDGTGFFHFGGDLHANRGRSRSGAAAQLHHRCKDAASAAELLQRLDVGLGGLWRGEEGLRGSRFLPRWGKGEG